MSTLLLIDPNGQRRARLEAACEMAGHRAYCAGTAAEGLRLAQMYVPEAVFLGGDLPDASAASLLSTFRSQQRPLLQRVLVISALPLAPGEAYTVRSGSVRPADVLSAVENALAARVQGCEELNGAKDG